MKKWMLCVLALAMVGVTFDTAEADGRRGRVYGSYSGSYGGHWGGGYAPYEGGWTGYGPVAQESYVGGWSGQYANAPMMSSGYPVAYQGEPVSPMMTGQPMGSPVVFTSYESPGTGMSINGGTSMTTPVYQSPAVYQPMSYPIYGPSSGFGFGGGCSGGG
jgi:hypothetical protein